MNLWDILILALLAALLIPALRRLRKTRKSGGCGCGCEGCARPCGKPGSGR